MAYKTLAQLRDQLRSRLGYSAMGSSPGIMQSNLNNILQEAQNILYWTHDWARLRRYTDTTIGTNQYLTDYPAAAHPDRITAISVLRGSIWSPPLAKGIDPQHYTTQANLSWPQRWQQYEQIETWPKADQLYSIRIFYIMNLGDFTANDDRATIDDSLIFTVALGDAKAHYRQPDAKTYTERAQSLLMSLKAKSWTKSVFTPDEYCVEEPLVKPQTV